MVEGSFHVPTLQKINKLLAIGEKRGDYRDIIKIQEDIQFALSRLEMMEARLKDVVFLDPCELGNIVRDLQRWVRHVKEVLCAAPENASTKV